MSKTLVLDKDLDAVVGGMGVFSDDTVPAIMSAAKKGSNVAFASISAGSLAGFIVGAGSGVYSVKKCKLQTGRYPGKFATCCKVIHEAMKGSFFGGLAVAPVALAAGTAVRLSSI